MDKEKIWAEIKCPVCKESVKEIWAPVGKVSEEPFNGSFEAHCPVHGVFYYSYGHV